MKLAAVLIVLALWINYQRGEDGREVPKRYHVAINCLYLALMAGAAVMVP